MRKLAGGSQLDHPSPVFGQTGQGVADALDLLVPEDGHERLGGVGPGLERPQGRFAAAAVLEEHLPQLPPDLVLGLDPNEAPEGRLAPILESQQVAEQLGEDGLPHIDGLEVSPEERSGPLPEDTGRDDGAAIVQPGDRSSLSALRSRDLLGEVIHLPGPLMGRV